MNLKKIIAGFTSAAVLCSLAAVCLPNEAEVSAADTSYPLQYFRLGMADTDANVNAAGNSLAPASANGTNAEKWSLNWVSEGVYEIVSADSGKILTANGSGISLAADSDGASQRWKIEVVQKDFEGFGLYYKITSNADSSKVLTYTENAGFSLSAYSAGNVYQKYKLNLDGCEGYAANAKVAGGEKACTIGGLLGEVVYVSSVEDMVAAMKDPDPLTIVLTANLDFKDWSKEDQTIKDNKTIVGSYAAHDVYDIQWRTDLFWGDPNVKPSNNIVFRNLGVTSRTLNGKVMIQVYSSRNVWFDHITFNNTLSYNRNGDGMDEVGKFIWINTPVSNWSDGCYNEISPDYITLSYLKLHNRYWTVAYGTQNTETTRCRTSVMYCDWEKTVRRTPQIGNGTGHIYNNYFEGYGEGSNGSGTGQIIGGEGSDILSECNRFQGYTLREALMMGGGNDPAKDNSSYLSTSTSGTPSKINFSPKVTSALNPGASIYGYSLINAYASNGNDVKKFCQTYSGAFSNAAGLKYITDSDMTGWIYKKYDCPFLRHVDFSAVSAASFVNGSTWRFKNVNSGLYMQVEGAKAANNTNVQQWGTSDGVTHDIWKLYDEGDGWYSIISAVGDGGTFALDIAGKKTADGTNADIYQYNGGDNQKFMITKNADGSCKIRTKITKGASAIEIANGGKGSGDNVQQWTVNGANCQDWIMEPVSDPGCRMNTSVVYEFENANSKMVMDIEACNMSENANVQQWSTGHFKSQKWVLSEFAGGGNYYYIRSYADNNFVLKAMSADNGGNIAIVPYSSKDSMMLFKFTKNPDGSYSIMTRASRDARFVEVGNASTSSGANVQQWEPTGSPCQNWNAFTETTTAATTATTTTTTTTTTSASTTSASENTTTTTTTTTQTTPDLPLKGDVDMNGSVNLIDIIKLQKHLLCLDAVPDFAAADVNSDGRVTIFDLMILKNIVTEK